MVLKSSSTIKKPVDSKISVIKKEVNTKVTSAGEHQVASTSTVQLANTSIGNKRKLKKSVHPRYQPVIAEFPGGEVLDIMTTYGQNLQLDISPRTHHAWSCGQRKANIRERSVATFNKKWGSLSF